MYQLSAARRARKHKHYGLFMDPGTGKTITALDILLQPHRRIQTVLVICPSICVGVWRMQIKQHLKIVSYVTSDIPLFFEKGHLTRIKFLILTIDSARIYWTALRDRFDAVIVDEAHRLCDRGSQQSERVAKIGESARHRQALTGTPLRSNELDLFGLYRFLDPSVFGDNWEGFADEYACKTGYLNKQFVPRPSMRKKLRRKAYRVAFRIAKEDALDLPPEVYQYIPFEIPPAARLIYEDIKRDMIHWADDMVITTPWAITQKLRLAQISSGFVRDDDENLVRVHTAKRDAFADWLIDRPTDEPLVIFYLANPDLDAITEVVESCKRKFDVIRGGVPERRKEARWRAFQAGRYNTLVAQISASGIGCELYRASAAMFYSLNYSFVDYRQARDRIHRHGQLSKVTYYHLYARASIEGKILRVLKRKEGIARLFNDLKKKAR